MGDFPSSRAKLYQEGLDILLRRWDESRGIQRNEVYGGLNLEDKKKLLNRVAAVTFEKNRYFFEQDEIERYIADYFSNLLNTKTERSQQYSEAVLKSIESQHGLLIERAQGIYSFSHLTFHEYFTAREIITTSDPYALKNWVSHVAEKRWREVFLLAVGMSPNADDLLLLMREKVNAIVAFDNKLQ
jgi:predicted NACHT family NTPase